MSQMSLRAHHLQSSKAIHALPKEEIIRTLIALGYVSSKENPFISHIYNTLVNAFKNPEKKVRLLIGGLDDICIECPRHQRGDCSPENPSSKGQWLEKRPAFCLSDYQYPIVDQRIVDKYGLNPEKVYTVSEIREKLNF